MPISVFELDDNISKVVLTGRIDIAGARKLDQPLSGLAEFRRGVVIDLSAVDFIASMGLRSLIIVAKSVNGKQGKVVLLNPQSAVEDVITISGIDTLVPIFRDEAAAIAAVRPVDA